ncbi:NifB/NifX family molybdenum-iron cluster-binding protein [Kiritimatiellota bacterium B12222]|nr:NifB/NifX family molybdenum-iron cluster-binding protein [Kiritimatiellota bacterium B12222]
MMKTTEQHPKGLVAIPVLHNRGPASQLSRHFGKSPGFMLVDPALQTFQYCESASMKEAGECAPISALVGQGCAVLICHSMGEGALTRCREAGLEIVKAAGGTEVAEVLHAYALGEYEAFPESALCRHDHDHCGEHAHGKEHDH